MLDDSTPGTPILFLLSQGTDPTSQLQRFADKHGRTPGDGLSIISLGKGQGPVAEAALREAMVDGGWVALLNCHLALSWMPTLDALVEDINIKARAHERQKEGGGSTMPSSQHLLSGGAARASEPISDVDAAAQAQASKALRAQTRRDMITSNARAPFHPDFRIWLTSMPDSRFPATVLQSSLKVAMEKPKGVRSDLLRTFKELEPESLELHVTLESLQQQTSMVGSAGSARFNSVRLTSFRRVNAPSMTHGSQATGPHRTSMVGSESFMRSSTRTGMDPLVGRGGHDMMHRTSSILRPQPADSALADPIAAAAAAEQQAQQQEHEQVVRLTPESAFLWARLIFSLASFHAVVQERRKFGALGWNIQYEFSAGDLECSLSTLRNLINVSDTGEMHVQWQALRYMVGDINYGGRVTDDRDRLLLACVLKRYLSEDLAAYRGPNAVGKAGLSSAARRRAGVPMPDNSLLLKVLEEGGGRPGPTTAHFRKPRVHPTLLEHIQGLPEVDAPEVFGLSRNADVAHRISESRRLVEMLLGVQPRATGRQAANKRSLTMQGSNAAALVAESVDEGAGEDAEAAEGTDALVVRMAGQILAQLPQSSSLNIENAARDHPNFRPLPSGHDNSLGVVVQQETEMFCRLLALLKSTLEDLQRAVKGLVVMSSDLEAMYTAILNNQVPAVWARAAYPSMRPLASWVADLRERVTFLGRWVTAGEPYAFWLSALFFPQGFLTALLQNQARRSGVAIDRLQFAFRLLPRSVTRENVMERAGRVTEGALVYGLFLEGAKLHQDSGKLGRGPAFF